MEATSKKPIVAIKPIIDRLLQMRQLWEDAAQNYFEPSRFMLSLQNCITTSRTVTFILQSNKDNIPHFDVWYEGHRQRWIADPIMKWAKEARNSIEKRGDLETHSQVRAEIIASYLKGPETEWMPRALFSTPQSIWRSIPARFRINHIIENGTLLIERRWVDSELPDMEVLEALAHVYDDFCSTLVDLLETNKLAVPPLLDRSRPDAMGELAMNRALYLSMRDGSITGNRYFTAPMDRPSDKVQKIAKKRYGANASWARLKEAKTLADIAAAFFANARAVMARDGYHHNLTFLLKDRHVIQMARTDHPDRASRYVLMRNLARLGRIANADGVMMIGEVWTASTENVPKSGFAVDAPDRGEAIVLNAANAKGETVHMSAEVIRKRPGSRKVKRVGPAHVAKDGFQYIFMPFFEEWGCVDETRMAAAEKEMQDAGIETPTIPPA